MKNLAISEKEVLVHNDEYAVIIFDDLNYDMLRRTQVDAAKDDVEKGIKKGDKKEVWKSIPCYSSNAQSAIKKFFDYSLKNAVSNSEDFVEAVGKMESLYSKIETQFNIENTVEYKRFKEEQADAIARLRK